MRAVGDTSVAENESPWSVKSPAAHSYFADREVPRNVVT